MNRIIAVTGAAGHLGRFVVSYLMAAGEKVRALLLSGETYVNPDGSKSAPEIYYGDIRDRADVDALLTRDSGTEMNVIHCAGLISIADRRDPRVYDVNVNGTKTLLAAAKDAGVRRFVYVSSVHAIPELPKGTVQAEISRFDPNQVVGDYARTKAIATQAVLDEASSGMDALVVHPSGIIGPDSPMSGKMMKLAADFFKGKMPVAVRGGFDFVDVRDAAKGILGALRSGRMGETYLLTGRFYMIREFLDALAAAAGKARTRIYLPIRFTRLFIPLITLISRIRKSSPLFTRYSLYTLSQNALFSHAKAASELGYTTRSLEETARDTIAWLTRKLEKNEI